MSYILDALKKAESERNLGVVPHLHAQPAVDALPARRPGWHRIALIMLALLMLASLASLAWLRPWQQQEAVYTVTVSNVTKPMAAPPGFATPAVMTAAPPVPKPVVKPTPPPAEPAKSGAADAVVPPTAGSLQDLPEHIRKELPSLTIGGYLYADKAADRSVLINNKLLREGEQIAPELRLEQMTPSGLVLNYRGYRYRTSY